MVSYTFNVRIKTFPVNEFHENVCRFVDIRDSVKENIFFPIIRGGIKHVVDLFKSSIRCKL